MPKNIVRIILSACFILLLAACGKEELPQPAPTKNKDALSHVKTVPLPAKDTYKNPKF